MVEGECQKMTSGMVSEKQTDYADLIAALAKVGSQPLWDRFKTLMTREPKAPDQPFIWPWAVMAPLVDRALAEVSMEDAERRVLLLANPAFGGKVKTTTNLNAAIQILGPHEEAHEHRHRLSAIRLVFEGGTGVTTVNEAHVPMARGDLILTPAMCWHGHINNGDERMVWLDGLDLPLALFDLDVVSFEPHKGPNAGTPPQVQVGDMFAQGGIVPQGIMPETGSSFPLLHYTWKALCHTFDQMPVGADGAKRVRYTNPVDGGSVLPTIDCYALELSQLQPTAAYRGTYNAVIAVLEGEGVSKVGDTEFHWKENDIFTLPHWNWISHTSKTEKSRLFMMTDREVLARLGYLVEEKQS